MSRRGPAARIPTKYYACANSPYPGNKMETIEPSELNAFAGHETDVTDWLKIAQTQINQFADCTLDHQFIHVDEKRARSGPFGSTIAHGFLSLSLLSHFLGQIGLVVKSARRS